MHVGWVPDASGRFGRAYTAAIKPLGCAFVYGLLLRSIGRQWQMQDAG